MAVNWSEILPDILVSIGKEIPYYEDFLTFSEVCSSWKTAADDCVNSIQVTGACQFPCLILPEKQKKRGRHIQVEEKQGRLRSDFFFLRTGKVAGVLLPSAISKKRCVPTSHGWILTYDKDVTRAPTLMHPFSGQEIALPTFSTLEDDVLGNHRLHLINKVALSSSDPSSPNFLVMVIWDGMRRLGICRPGDASWAVSEEEKRFCMYDISFHDGRLFGVTICFEVFVCDVYGPHPTNWKLIRSFPKDYKTYDQCLYIVKSGLDNDKFLIVIRLNQGYYEGIEDEYSTDEDEDDVIEEQKSAEEYLSDNIDDDESDEENDEQVDESDEENDEQVDESVEENDEQVDESDEENDEQVDESDDEDDEDIDETDDEDDRKKKFRVFEFSLKDEDGWVELEDLGGDRALFLGYNTSFFIKANVDGCIKPDCIYFTDDVSQRYMYNRKGGGKDMGIYNLRDGTIKPHFDLWKSRSHITPPSWIFDETSL